MRPLVPPAVLAASLCLTLAPPAHAESVLELAGGLMTPIEDDSWTDYVESSPKLALRAGSIGPRLGGLLSIDWTPLANDDLGLGNAVEVSSHRFRVLLNAATHQRVAPKLSASVRVGFGIDVARVSVDTNFFGVTDSRTDTDSGLALEVAGGLWFDVGGIQLGGELAVPMAFHGDSTDDDIPLDDYSSIDVDVLFGVRFRSP